MVFAARLKWTSALKVDDGYVHSNCPKLALSVSSFDGSLDPSHEETLNPGSLDGEVKSLSAKLRKMQVYLTVGKTCRF